MVDKNVRIFTIYLDALIEHKLSVCIKSFEKGEIICNVDVSWNDAEVIAIKCDLKEKVKNGYRIAYNRLTFK